MIRKSNGSSNVTSDTQLLWNLFKNSLLISASSFEKHIVTKKYCISQNVDKMSFLPSCRYHNLLIGDIKELLQNLDPFCFNYHYMDCLYELFKYRFCGKNVVKSGQPFDNRQKAVHCNQQNGGMDKVPASRKTSFRGKAQKPLLRSFQKSKSTQASGSVFADRIVQIKKTKFELELIKIVDCILDCHGNYTKNLVSIKIKSS